MHILWLRPDKPANISVGRHRIALELESRGHDVDVRNTTIPDFWQVLRDSPDVIVGTTRLGAFVGAWKHVLSGTPLVIDHIDPIAQLQRSHRPSTVWGIDKVEKLAFRIADHVMVVYDGELPRVSRHTTNITQTSLGVDYDLFADPPSETIEKARDTVSAHVPSDSRILLYVGGLEPPYHVQTIVNAMDYLDGWHFVVLGDGSQREQIENAATDLQTVHYLETVPYEEVPGYMHVSDVGISLLDDANTLKILEYGAARLPVVHIEGNAEAVLDGSVTFCSLDSADVADAVERAVMSETEELQRFAQQRSWESIAETYEEVLCEL